MGSLPAILGLVVLMVIFSLASDTFTTTLNMANLVTQAGPICVLALGLVPVLLLGEIDLSAGVAGSTGAMATGLLMVDHGQSWSVAALAALVVGAVDRPGHRPARGPPRHPVVRGDPGLLPGPPGRAAEVHRAGRLGPLQRRGAARSGDQERRPAVGLDRRGRHRRGVRAAVAAHLPDPGRPGPPAPAAEPGRDPDRRPRGRPARPGRLFINQNRSRNPTSRSRACRGCSSWSSRC